MPEADSASTPQPGRLLDQLQIGTMLVDELLTVHRRAIDVLDRELARRLRRWAASVVSEHAPVPMQCGGLRRDPDGTWWWGTCYLGRDHDPESLLDLGNELGTIVAVLGQALEAAAERLDKLRDHEGSSAAHRVLRRLRHWRETGVW